MKHVNGVMVVGEKGANLQGERMSPKHVCAVMVT